MDDDAKVGLRRVRSVKDVINLYDDRNNRNADIDSSSSLVSSSLRKYYLYSILSCLSKFVYASL